MGLVVGLGSGPPSGVHRMLAEAVPARVDPAASAFACLVLAVVGEADGAPGSYFNAAHG